MRKMSFKLNKQESLPTPVKESKNMITSFEEINLIDPFLVQKDDGEVAKVLSSKIHAGDQLTKHIIKKNSLKDVDSIKKLVYDNSRFNATHPPVMVFTPSRDMMRKLMRISASVADYSELYLFL